MYKITVGCFIILEGDIIANLKDVKSIYLLSFMSIALSILAVSICFLVLTSNISAKEYLPTQTRGWDINFFDLSGVKLTGSAKELAKPIIGSNSTYIKNFYVSFEKTGDSATYVLNLKNKGIFDARIADIVITDPRCYSKGENSSKDSELVCDNIEFIATYDSGRTIKKDDILKRGDKENLNVTIRYNGEMPSNTVEVENLSMTIIYVQE